MEETLEGALKKLFGEGAASSSSSASSASDESTSSAPSDLAREAAQHYDRARAAQRADDWATYGAEMQKLGDVLKRMNAQQRKTP